jgi:probable lipoprotein NlpC
VSRRAAKHTARACLLLALTAFAGCGGSCGGPGEAGGGAEAVVAPPRIPTPEERLRAELDTWKDTPYLQNGKTRTGIGNSGFVSAVFRGAFGLDIPSEYVDLMRTGKLVARDKIEPGDVVFFEGGFIPFKTKIVGIYVANDQVALATRDLGITTVRMSEGKWNTMYKSAHHIPRDPSVGAPNFDASKFGSNRAALLHEIAKAWSGTLYLQGGTTFDGIGNDEFVRNVYEAIYDTELEGTPAQWATMGDAVPKDKLEPGDIILYQAVGMGSMFGQKHAGMYIGDGEFVHSVKGSAVTISKLDEDRWSQAYRTARRIDPEVLTRIAETRAAEAAKTKAEEAEKAKAERAAEAEKAKAAAAEKPAPPPPPPTPPPPAKGKQPPKGKSKPPAAAAAKPTEPAEPTEPAAAPVEAPTSRVVSEEEKRLRANVEPWIGTPYKLGGETKAGIDCSAFTRAVYKSTYGVQIPRVVQDQKAMSTAVARDKLEVGDLVFFRTQGMGPMFKSWHVGIYVGNGEFAQSSGRRGVIISRLDNYYWNKKYVGAGRLPKQPGT